MKSSVKIADRCATKPKAARKRRARCGAPNATTAADVIAAARALADAVRRFDANPDAAPLLADSEIDGALEEMWDAALIGAALLDEATGGPAIP